MLAFHAIAGAPIAALGSVTPAVETLSDGLVASDATDLKNIPSLFERLAAEPTLSASNAMNAALEDGAEMDLGLRIVLRALCSDEAQMTSATVAVLTRVEQLIETLLLTEAVATQQQALAVIAEALLIEDLARGGWSVDALSGMEMADAVTARARIVAAALASASLGATAVPTLQMTALVAENMDAADALGTSARMFEALTDGMVASLALRIGDDEYTAWVLSINKRLADGSPVPAVVEYRNFPFNGFTKFNGKYYGTSDHGLFELVGDDDDGTEIDAWVRSALNTFGTSRLKQMPKAYLGIKTDGTMVLKVITVNKAGDKVEDWYTLRDRPSTAIRDASIPVGNGLKSVYWAWELHNKDGADFELDSIEFLPLALSRRTQNGK